MELFDTKQETNNKVTVVDNRKLNVGLALSSNYLNTAFDPEKSTVKEWKEKLKDLVEFEPPRPIGKNLITRQYGKDSKHSSKLGLVEFDIPETYQQKPGFGIVVAIGPEVPKDQVKRGDIVKFGLFSAEEVKYDGEIFQLINFNDIKYVESVVPVINKEEIEVN